MMMMTMMMTMMMMMLTLAVAAAVVFIFVVIVDVTRGFCVVVGSNEFVMSDEEDDDVVSCFRRCFATIVIRPRIINGGVGTKDDDGDRRLVVGRSVVGSRLIVDSSFSVDGF